MIDIKKYWIDFVEGRISVPDFIEYTKIHSEVLDFLTDIADKERFKTYVTHKIEGPNGYPEYIQDELPFDAKLSLQRFLGEPGMLGNYLNIHYRFSVVFTAAFPDENITIDQTLREKHLFMLDACPEYIEGVEVYPVIDRVFEEIPQELSRTKRIRMFKERIKQEFHVEGNKYPRWIQGGEWPLGQNNKPMRFIEQKQKKGKGYGQMLYTLYFFEDVETGEQKIVEQFT